MRVGQVLWSGLFVDAGESFLRVADEELGSLRRLQALEVVCEDVLPRTLSDIRRLCYQLEQKRGHLSREDFERTVLTMVYTAQKLAQAAPGHQRELWERVFLQLFKAVKGDLRAEWLRTALLKTVVALVYLERVCFGAAKEMFLFVLLFILNETFLQVHTILNETLPWPYGQISALKWMWMLTSVAYIFLYV